MGNQELNALRYPVGHFQKPTTFTAEIVENWINDIEILPSKLKAAVENLSEDQLNTPYRPGGWTVKQVVHHVVDSHINSYVRFKWTLTEDKPMIKAYNESDWAELSDYSDTPISVSLHLLDYLHQRWVILLKKLTPADLEQLFIHPESGDEVRLDENIGIYAWHGKHHLAHITRLAERMGW